MNEAVVAGALAVAALNLLAGLDGLLAIWLGDTTGHAARIFWTLLRVGQGASLTLAAAVGSLAAAGQFSTGQLLYLYALRPLAISFLAEPLPLASAQAAPHHRGVAGPAAGAPLRE